MNEKEIRTLRNKIGTDPILTDEEIEYIWMAMDKQGPMKTNGKDYNCCGCGHNLGFDSPIPNHCPNCGQAIDWSEE